MYETKPYFYGTGRRKNSVARVRVYTGTGKITIRPGDPEADRSSAPGCGRGRRQVRHRGPRERRRRFRPGRRHPSRPLPRPAAVRRESASCSEEGWLPDPRSSYEGAQEVRPQSRSSRAPVQQTLNFLKSIRKPRNYASFAVFLLIGFGKIRHLL